MIRKLISGSRKAALTAMMIVLVLIGGGYGLRIRAQEPSVTLNETDSKILIEASQAAVTANAKLQSVFETLCRQNGKDPTKYTVAPSPGQPGRVDLKPIEAAPAAQGK